MKIGLLAKKVFDPVALTQAQRDSDAFKSRTRLVWLDPEIFLKIARPIPAGASTDKLDFINELMAKGKKFSDIPLLLLEYEGGGVFKCYGHEGRHRAMWIRDNMPKALMPVRLIDSQVRWVEEGLVDTDILIKREVGNSYQKVRV